MPISLTTYIHFQWTFPVLAIPLAGSAAVVKHLYQGGPLKMNPLLAQRFKADLTLTFKEQQSRLFRIAHENHCSNGFHVQSRKAKGA